MEKSDRKTHWEHIYQTKALEDVSWFQPVPETSLDFFKRFNIPKTAKIIDIGGGDSFLVDHLLDLGYKDISVLDISEAAIERAKQRLGDRSTIVHWIVADVVNFKSAQKYDVWHDRAAFHFLTNEHEITSYLEIARQSLHPEGLLILGTFSNEGPGKCSGLTVQQYSEHSITERLSKYFQKIECIKVDHKTPIGAVQNFLFCCFQKHEPDE